MSLTTGLAIYAAIVSSVLLGWNLYREFHDRARVKISVSLMRIHRKLLEMPPGSDKVH
jgi:hypothetical protein